MNTTLEIPGEYDIVPLSNRLIVKVDKAETKTAGGIIIPDDAQEKPLLGTVVAVGPGTWYNGEYEPMEVEIGMRVVFNQFAGKDVAHEGIEYKVMRTEDVEFKLIPKKK